MARGSTSQETFRIHLMAGGAQSARDLAHKLGSSQPTVSRQIASLGAAIERIGRGPATRYALRRPVRGRGLQWPVYRVDPAGAVDLFGFLTAIHGGFRMQFERPTPPRWIPLESARFGLFPGLPFFLQDCRPQGYLGRAIARTYSSSILVPDDVRKWSDDDALVYFLAHGDDLPGNLLVGDEAAQSLAHAHGVVVAAGNRPEAYGELAAQTERGEVAGSSAGGEQPKFAVAVRESSGAVCPVLVKFTTDEPSVVRDRWSDLLVCEHIALEVLRSLLGIEASASTLLDYRGRRFLEVTRFDRVGAKGRRGVLSLGAILDANSFAPVEERWPEAAQALSEAGLLENADVQSVRRIWFFGQCIGNTDMHRGNLSFALRDDGPFALAPVYDMLPMAYAPTSQGSVPSNPIRLPGAVPRFREDWDRAASAAQKFWEMVRDHPLVTSGFRKIADEWIALLGVVC